MEWKQELEVQAGRNVFLTPFKEEDAVRIAELLDHPEIERWTLRIPSPYLLSHATGFLSDVETMSRTRERVTHFAIRNRNGLILGAFSFEELVLDHCCEIGYWLARDHWGKGIMTDVIRTMSDYGFRTWSLKRIQARVFDGNIGSCRALEKAGYEREGTLRKLFMKKGRLIDGIVYATFAEE